MTLPMVERDLSSSAKILLSCSILAIIRSISEDAFSALPGSGEEPMSPAEPDVAKLEDVLV